VQPKIDLSFSLRETTWKIFIMAKRGFCVWYCLKKPCLCFGACLFHLCDFGLSRPYYRKQRQFGPFDGITEIKKASQSSFSFGRAHLQVNGEEINLLTPQSTCSLSQGESIYVAKNHYILSEQSCVIY
jgi:hypothetical protein